MLLHLSGHFHSLKAHRWFQYDTRSGYARFCQPDGFDFDGTTLTLFEIKLTHVLGARMQMQNLYAPVLSYIYKPAFIRYVEIVKGVNDTPKECKFHMDFAEFIEHDFVPGEYEVLRWKL